MKREPLDTELAALFANAPRPTPPDGASARVLTRLTSSLLGAPSGKDAAADSNAHVARGVSRLSIGLASFGVGAIIGATAIAWLRPDAAPRIVYVDRPMASVMTATAVPPPVASSSPLSPLTPLPLAPPRAEEAATRPNPPSATRDDLAEERKIIDDARTRLAAGDAQTALARLDDHARRYPHARLGEEREALAVQALVIAGRYPEARARAAAFRAHSPSSVYQPAIDAALQSIP